MNFDVTTLLIISSFITVMSGGLLIVARFQYRDTGPILWWAAAYFVDAGATLALAGAGAPPQGVPGIAAFTLLVMGTALVWSGARRLCGLSAPLWLTFAPAATILPIALVSPLPVFVSAGMLATVFTAGYMYAAAWSFAFQAREQLLSRWPLAVLCLLHAIAFTLTAMLQLPPDQVPFWLELVSQMINFEGPLFVFGSAIFVVAWTRESNEMRHKAAADTDLITGLASRRAFFASAERVLERCRLSETPAVVVVFDLDHFKTINDSFGHHVGDRVLEVFGAVVNRTLRPHDVVGRVGGEEFAVVAAGSGTDVGVALADRVRRAFAEAARVVDGLVINGTLSAGVSAYGAGDDLAAVLKRADAALYRAKVRGRNRVEATGTDEPVEASNVVRIA